MRYNLVDEKWIPTSSGTVSLMDVASGGVGNLSGNPLTVIPVLRFLVALSTRAVEMSGKDWSRGDRLTKLPLGDILKDYLNKNKDLFDIFDPNRPFLQIPESKFPVSKYNTYPLRRIFSTDSVGSNGYKMDFQISDTNSLPDLARGLLEIQTYAPGYKKGEKSEAYGKVVTTINVDPSPIWGFFRGGVHHLMLWGKDILETIMLNMFSKNTLDKIFVNGLGTPIWEVDASSKDPTDENGISSSFYGHMVPAHHKYIRIQGEELIYAFAKKEDVNHNLTLYHYTVDRRYKNKETGKEEVKYELHVTPPRNLFWKELGAFLAEPQVLSYLMDRDKLKGKKDVVIKSMGISELGKPSMGLYNFGGSLEDSSMVYPLVNRAKRDMKIKYTRGCRVAERGGSYLRSQIQSYLNEANVQKPKKVDLLLDQYWNLLSAHKDTITQDLTLWSKKVKQTMMQVFDSLSAQSVKDIQIKNKHLAYLRRKKI